MSRQREQVGDIVLPPVPRQVRLARQFCVITHRSTLDDLSLRHFVTEPLGYPLLPTNKLQALASYPNIYPID